MGRARAVALREGTRTEAIAVVRDDRATQGLTPREALLVDTVRALYRARRLTAEQFARAEAELGRKGLIEVVTLAGYYGMVAAVLNAFEVDLPPGTAPAFGRRAAGAPPRSAARPRRIHPGPGAHRARPGLGSSRDARRSAPTCSRRSTPLRDCHALRRLVDEATSATVPAGRDRRGRPAAPAPRDGSRGAAFSTSASVRSRWRAKIAALTASSS